ncbi:phosphoglycolate phosphatase [Methylobacterium oryzisoli]|uniref:phosphoglycolate phosphatase n=1 Tax=Methylobacterium oryzisoli TaxID=3385502 RepID=UPI003891750E
MPLDRSRFDAVLLDLDGTLIDSLGDLGFALDAVLEREGLRPVTAAEVRTMVGDGALALVRRALQATGGDPDRAAALLPAFLAVYEPVAATRTRLFPGAAETVRRLGEAGFALAVVTNKPARATGLILEAVGLASSIHAVLGGDTLAHRKPAPEPVWEALRRLGTAPGRAVLVGDMHHDIEAARAAGVAAILARYGYGRPDDAEAADAVIDDIGELPAAIAALSHAPG